MKTARIIFKVDPLFSKCPSCRHINTIKYSRPRNGFEAAVKKTTFLKMCRCQKCGWRGYLSSLALDSNSFKYLAIYTGIVILVAYLVTLILKKIS